MKISAFTIVRNGVLLKYPFVEAIQSALPLVDEFIVVIGAGEDNTREMVLGIGSEKIKIIDTVWDPELRTNGTILAHQTNVGIEAISGDWGIYLQADEMIHEKDLDAIRQAMLKVKDDNSVEGILFDYYHFWGYHHTCVTRRTYRREIRIIKNIPGVFSYKDAQGFRKFNSKEEYDSGVKGDKLKVAHLKGPRIYAYSRVRSPKDELEKVKHIARYWHTDEFIENKYNDIAEWDYSNIDALLPFKNEDHPILMQEKSRKDDFKMSLDKMKFPSFKYWFLYQFERFTGWRIGEYKNYKIVKRI